MVPFIILRHKIKHSNLRIGLDGGIVLSEQQDSVYRVLVQLGAFLLEARAQQLKKSLDDQGKLSYIRRVDLNKQTFFRVIEQVGSYQDEANANQQMEKLKRSGKIAFVEKVNIVRNVPKLQGKIIVLDPGHGGSALGAIGPMGTMEKQINLQVAKLVKEKLLREGATVHLTRESDVAVSLYLRPELANSLHANVFVSLHMDGSTNRAANGSRAIYRQTPGSYDLAKLMEINLKQCLGLRNLGVMVDARGLAVLRRAKVPAVLVEMAFISNPQEEALFRGEATQQKAAQAIFEACLEYCTTH